MANTFNIYGEISNEKQDIINPLQKENNKYLIHYTIQKRLSPSKNYLWDNKQKQVWSEEN